jgi:hypothetical protein
MTTLVIINIAISAIVLTMVVGGLAWSIVSPRPSRRPHRTAAAPAPLAPPAEAALA